MYRRLSILLLSACISSGCGLNPSEAGFGGAAVGAGTGAIIGNMLSNGDVAKSALAGWLIGFPVGIALNLAAQSLFTHQTQPSQKDYSEEIEANQREIIRRNAEIEDLRESVDQETPRENPPTGARGRIFDGATLGNYYR